MDNSSHMTSRDDRDTHMVPERTYGCPESAEVRRGYAQCVIINSGSFADNDVQDSNLAGHFPKMRKGYLWCLHTSVGG